MIGVVTFSCLAGRYHKEFQQYESVNTYCSVCHPWRINGHWVTLRPDAMFWVGFRHAHSFIRVRLHTTEIVTPGETWADHQRPLWLEERRTAFEEAIKTLELPIEPSTDGKRLLLKTARQDTPFFCSWPDAFGPCQFEYNSPDVFEFLVPASRLATTHSEAANIRVYLTGFPQSALFGFQGIEPQKRLVYRCSAHCMLSEIPEILSQLGHCGRLYTTLCEFQTQALLPNERDAAAIVGIVGEKGSYQIEVRLSQSPLPRPEMGDCLEQLLKLPMRYAPLSAFP